MCNWNDRFISENLNVGLPPRNTNIRTLSMLSIPLDFCFFLSLSHSLCTRKQCEVRIENNEFGRIMSLFHRFPSPNDYPVENLSMEFIIYFHHFSLWLLVTPFRMDWWKMHTFLCCCSHRNNEIGWACNDQNHAIISIDQKRCTHTRTHTHTHRRTTTSEDVWWTCRFHIPRMTLDLSTPKRTTRLNLQAHKRKTRPDRSINSSFCC